MIFGVLKPEKIWQIHETQIKMTVTEIAINKPHVTLPAEPVKPDIKARRSSQLAIYSLYKLHSNTLKRNIKTA